MNYFDVELKRKRSPVLIPSSFRLVRFGYEQFSPSFAECAITPEDEGKIPPFCQIDIYYQSDSERVLVWRGWLLRETRTLERTILYFGGPRQLLQLTAAPKDKLQFRTNTAGILLRVVYDTIIQSFESSSPIDTSNWMVYYDCGVPLREINWLNTTNCLEAIEVLESKLPGWIVSIAPDTTTTTTKLAFRWLRRPLKEIILCPGDITEVEYDYSTIANSLLLKWTGVNLVPNGGFTNPVLQDGLGASILHNPSFEGSGGIGTPPPNWTPPNRNPFYWEWDTDYGHSGRRNFKFHHFAEYHPDAWLVSSGVGIDRTLIYTGRFFYGCDPWLAYPDYPANTVKLKWEVRGYSFSGQLTEIAASGEVTDNFHRALHWHAVDIPPFQFTDDRTSYCVVAFNTYRAKRLYLDDVIISPADEPTQEGWTFTRSQNATLIHVDWLVRRNDRDTTAVSFYADLPDGEWLQLEQIDFASFPEGKTLYAAFKAGNYLHSKIYIEWKKKDGSTQRVLYPPPYTVTEEEPYIYKVSVSNITPPEGAIAFRMIIRWESDRNFAFGTTIYYVYLGEPLSSTVRVDDDYVYRWPRYDAGDTNFEYPGEAEPFEVEEARNSPTKYGTVLADVGPVEGIRTESQADEYAGFYFLQRATSAITATVEGASIDDIRILFPHYHAWRLPPPIAKPMVVRRLTVNADGSWDAELGEFVPDIATLLRSLELKNR